jgi:type II secretory pathway component GspD/PulD (secretin)
MAPRLRPFSFAALLGVASVIIARTTWSQTPNPPQFTFEAMIVELTEDPDEDLNLVRVLGIARNTSHPWPAIGDENAKRSLLDPRPGNTLHSDTIRFLEWTISAAQFQTVLGALEQRPGTRISTARITSLNGQRAKFADFKERFDALSVGRPSSLGSNSMIEVLPQSTGQDAVSITVTPTIKTFVGYAVIPHKFLWAYEGPPLNPGAHAQRAPMLPPDRTMPVFRERQLVTTATVHNGETIVLSLPVSEASKPKNKIPFLGDLPIAGRLVRNQAKSMRTETVLVFITPVVVR